MPQGLKPTLPKGSIWNIDGLTSGVDQHPMTGIQVRFRGASQLPESPLGSVSDDSLSKTPPDHHPNPGMGFGKRGRDHHK